MNGRVYSPGIGRMLSPDPVTQEPESGQNYNRYSYAFNNPLTFTDPSGFCNDRSEYQCQVDGGNGMEETHVTGRDLSGFGFGGGFTSGAAGLYTASTPTPVIGDRATDSLEEAIVQPGPVDEEDACADKGSSCQVQHKNGETILTLESNSVRNRSLLSMAGMSLSFAATGFYIESIGGSAGFTNKTKRFRWYANGWPGNQHISTASLTKLGFRVGAAGLILGVGNDLNQLSKGGPITPIEAAVNTAFGVAGMFNSYIAIASISYSFTKEYGAQAFSLVMGGVIAGQTVD